MEKSKLIDLLQSFSPTDLRKFKEFVASPYFNKNKELIHFLQHLEGLAPEYAADKVKKDVVYTALFPGETFDKKKMGHLMNYLLKLAEQFLAIERYQKEDRLLNVHTLNQFVDRKLDKHYHYLSRKAQSSLEEKGVRDENDFYYKYLISRAATDHFDSKLIRKFDPSLQQTSDELDQFYFFNKLKYSCEMLNRKAIIAADYHLPFIEEVKSYLLEKESLDPLIETYLRIFLTISQPDKEEHFEILLKLMGNLDGQLSHKIQQEIYSYAINYCAPQIRKGKSKYVSIMLDLYVEGINNKAFFDGDYLSHWTYNNVVKLALRLQRFEWAENFITEYANSLPPQLSEDAKYFNMAEVFFLKKDYDGVLTNLNQLQFTDLHYHLGSRVILLKTYYEQDAEEPLYSLLASFSVYLRRNKQISLAMKKNCLNFCNVLNQILRRNPKKWESIGKDIREMQPLAERAWLNQVWEENKI